MDRVKFTVTYELDKEIIDWLNKITERWRKEGQEITPEELFSFIMTIDGDEGLRKYLYSMERILD